MKTVTLFCRPVYKANRVKTVRKMLTKAVVLVIATFSPWFDSEGLRLLSAKACDFKS